MNSTPERPLDPPEATIVSEPEFERDPLSLQMIDAKVVIGSFLAERIHLALKLYDETDSADVDVWHSLLKEAIPEIDKTHELAGKVLNISESIERLTNQLQSSPYQGSQA
jgi:hypothetical protein